MIMSYPRKLNRCSATLRGSGVKSHGPGVKSWGRRHRADRQLILPSPVLECLRARAVIFMSPIQKAGMLPSALALCATETYVLSVPAGLKEPKTHRFAARVTAADKELFQKAAAIEGRSLAKFIIAHTREVARRVVAQSSQIQLDPAQSRRFVEALLAPPQPPTATFKRARARYQRQVEEG
jgi:uncharacterized protein (DUF1778 family)